LNFDIALTANWSDRILRGCENTQPLIEILHIFWNDSFISSIVIFKHIFFYLNVNYYRSCKKFFVKNLTISQNIIKSVSISRFLILIIKFLISQNIFYEDYHIYNIMIFNIFRSTYTCVWTDGAEKEWKVLLIHFLDQSDKGRKNDRKSLQESCKKKKRMEIFVRSVYSCPIMALI